MKKRILFFLAVLLIVGCSSNNPSKKSNENSNVEVKTIKLGTSILQNDILEKAKPIFEKSGKYKMDIQVFDDVIQPNVALTEKKNDVNFYQHRPFLATYNQNNGTDLKTYGVEIVGSNLGLYSKKYKSLEEIADGSSIAVANDSSNETAALKLLEANNLIRLDPSKELVTALDIVENPKNLKIVEAERLTLVNALDDVDCSVILADVAQNNGLDPQKDPIVSDTVEDVKKRGVLLVVRGDQKEEEWLIELERALTDNEVKQFITETYKGAKIPLY